MSGHLAPGTAWLVGAALLGIALTVTVMNAHAGDGFRNLKRPSEYFSDARTVALLQAALAGDAAKAKQLVAEGANPNDEGPKVPNENRLRLLHYAIAAKNKNAVRVLIAVGADPEQDGKNYGTAFDFANNLGDLDALNQLLDLRPVATLSQETIKSLLFESAFCPRPRETVQLMLKRGVAIDFPDSSGWTRLMRALSEPDLELAEWLLHHGASVKRDPEKGMTPAYLVDEGLAHYKVGSKTYLQLERIKALMQAAGSVFPAPVPRLVRENRARNKQ